MNVFENEFHCFRCMCANYIKYEQGELPVDTTCNPEGSARSIAVTEARATVPSLRLFVLLLCGLSPWSRIS